MFINDIIITPDGNVYPDWDFVENKEFCQDFNLYTHRLHLGEAI